MADEIIMPATLRIVASPAELLRRGEKVDLDGARLVGEDLRGLDLSGRDLSGADLTRADLTGAILIGADLRDATLHETQLGSAELAGADLRGAHCEHCIAPRAGFGRANLEGASFFGAHLEDASFVESIVDHADFRTAHAHGARFCRADVNHTDFSRAELQGADFEGANVAHANFVEADLRRCRLRSLSGFESAAFLRADVRDVDFSGAYMLRRHVLDTNYLDEFKHRSAVNRVLYFVWWLSSDCGRSMFRWFMLTALVTLGFGFAYRSVDIDYGAHETEVSPWYFSVVTLTTLGFGDVLPKSVAAQVLVMVQVGMGYFMLGGLLSIFASKMARRGE